MKPEMDLASKRVLVLLFNKFSSDSRVLKECSTLVRAGYSVELWAVYDPQLPEVETVNGFLVRRKFRKPTRKSFLTKKKLKYLARLCRNSVLKLPMLILSPFPSAYKLGKGIVNRFEDRVSQILKGVFQIVSSIKKPRFFSKRTSFPFDIIHCNDLLPLPIATELKKQHPRVKLIYDTHEYQTELSGLQGQPLKRIYFQTLEKKNIYDADSVITVSPSIATEYERIYGLKKVNVIKNCPDLSSKQYAGDHFEKVFGLTKNEIIFLYQGGFTEGKGIEETIGSFIRLSKLGVKTHHIIFMGMGGLEGEIKRAANEYPNIHYHPAIHPDQIPEISSSADYGIFFAPNASKNHWFCLPNKVFEYITCGLPVIVSPLYEVNKLVNQEKIGYVAKDFDEQSLFELLQGIREKPSQEMRDRIRKVHQSKLNWSIEEKKLLEIYGSLAA